MIVALDYLQSDPATGVLSFRRKFPKDLIPFIPSASPIGRGRTELKVSLRARAMNEPGASDNYVAAQATFDRITAEAKATKALADRRASGQFDRLTESGACRVRQHIAGSGGM